jgi:hypothetical protein
MVLENPVVYLKTLFNILEKNMEVISADTREINNVAGRKKPMLKTVRKLANPFAMALSKEISLLPNPSVSLEI